MGLVGGYSLQYIIFVNLTPKKCHEIVYHARIETGITAISLPMQSLIFFNPG